MNEHTPGPWEVRHQGETIGRLMEQRPGKPRKFVTLAHCYSVSTFDALSGEALGTLARAANARLIASSPDLYAALRDLVESVEDHESYIPDGEVMSRAYAALAKAKGE
jgi:hypothetical protein